VEPSVRHGLIAEAGMYFSLLRRAFLQRYANAPGDLPAALVPTACPSAAACS
jgi:hypothetical protein